MISILINNEHLPRGSINPKLDNIPGQGNCLVLGLAETGKYGTFRIPREILAVQIVKMKKIARHLWPVMLALPSKSLQREAIEVPDDFLCAVT